MLQNKGLRDILLLFRVRNEGLLYVTERNDLRLMGILWFALIVCIMLSAFFSATETAYSASNRVRLRTVEGPRKESAAGAGGS